MIEEKITSKNCLDITRKFEQEEKELLNYSQAAAWSTVFWFLKQKGMSNTNNESGIENVIGFLEKNLKKKIKP